MPYLTSGDLSRAIHNYHLLDGYTVSLVAYASGNLPYFGLDMAFSILDPTLRTAPRSSSVKSSNLDPHITELCVFSASLSPDPKVLAS